MHSFEELKTTSVTRDRIPGHTHSFSLSFEILTVLRSFLLCFLQFSAFQALSREALESGSNSSAQMSVLHFVEVQQGKVDGKIGSAAKLKIFVRFSFVKCQNVIVCVTKVGSESARTSSRQRRRGGQHRHHFDHRSTGADVRRLGQSLHRAPSPYLQ